MRNTFTLLMLLALVSATTGLRAQEDGRYVEPQFTVMPFTSDTFGTNFSVLTGSPVQDALLVDVYMPEGDTVTNRPVVAIFPTGNFLPAYINQSPYGTRRDSANVYLAEQLAARGFVAMVADYRQGWLPTATTLERRTETLLQAAYRGSQDAHALARYLRRSVAENNNPYGIDGDRITFWGLGTGGYVALTHAFLDTITDLETNDQFFNADGILLVNEARDGDVEGTRAGQLNLVNNPGYDSDVALTVNAGGAIGDTNWIITGNNNTSAVIGMHRVEDPFAPFNVGTVIVPTTGNAVVSGVGGSHAVVRVANRVGINDELAAANNTDLSDMFSDLSEDLNELNAEYQDMMLDENFPLSYNNLFPFVGTGGQFAYADETTARAIIGQINASGQTAELDADFIINTERGLNSNFDNPAGAQAVMDSMIAFFLPRAFIALDLMSTSVDFVTPESVNFELFPNPTTTGFTIQVADANRIRQIDVYDMRGSRVAQVRGINQSTYTFDRGNLANGAYIVQLRFDEGVTARKVMLR